MRKIEAIVREEMDASGAQEIRMPILLPSSRGRRPGGGRRTSRSCSS